MWKFIKSWTEGNAFKGQGFVFKLMRFLHLMEQDTVQLSLTGLQMWATTWLNIQTQIATHDHITMGIAAATNGGAMIAHAVDRKQRLAAGASAQDDVIADDGPPPWQGEEEGLG